MNSMKHLKEYILENVDIVNEEDLLGLGDDKKDDKKDDKGSEPEIDPELKERAEIKFKIWKDGGELANWITDKDGYQKIEYVYKDKEKGITIDFLIGRKDG